MTNIIPFPTPKLIRNTAVLTPDYAQQKTISWVERLAAAQDARDRMAVVTEWLERFQQRLAEH